MRALTVIPLQAGSAAVTDMPEPERGPGEAPDGSGFAPGDLVVGVVRRPDDVKVVLDL